MSEFDLISRLQEIICIPQEREIARATVGIGDDGAVLAVPSGHDLVVCTDTLVAGVHFPDSTDPQAIGYKALAVNLSDLAAMGAQPAWFFMALTLPSGDEEWLESFAGGMAGLAASARIMLAGGDVTSGPLSITVTALGLVEKDSALTRSNASAGDLIVASGTLGAAAHALSLLKKGEVPTAGDRKALDYPTPRLQLGRALQGLATSCIDISDGLAADLGHILEQSGVGAEIRLEKLPCPESLSGLDGNQRWPLQLSGGDDYELCFTVPRGSETRLASISKNCGVDLSVIGKICSGNDLVLKTAEDDEYESPVTGYLHFD